MAIIFTENAEDIPDIKEGAMKKNLLLLLLCSCATSEPAVPPSDLMVCGGDEVFILRLRGGVRKIWSWRAVDRPEIPEEMRKNFGSIDDCKPVDGGRKILITSSGGAAALVERATGKVLFHASAPNAHSAEVLPGNRVVVACSTKPDGNRLDLYDLSVSDKPLASDELQGAHGVVYDEARNVLWALGTFELRSYHVGANLLVRRQTFALPNDGGHDLRPIPDRPGLVVTTHHHVWVFDRDLLTFRPFPRLGDAQDVKSMDFDPESGALAYVKAEKGPFAERVSFLGLDRRVEVPGAALYKARWTPALD
jgi:hypothetical protein